MRKLVLIIGLYEFKIGVNALTSCEKKDNSDLTFSLIGYYS